MGFCLSARNEALDRVEAFTPGTKVYFCYVCLQPDFIPHTNLSVNRKAIILTGGKGFGGNVSADLLGV